MNSVTINAVENYYSLSELKMPEVYKENKLSVKELTSVYLMNIFSSMF